MEDVMKWWSDQVKMMLTVMSCSTSKKHHDGIFETPNSAHSHNHAQVHFVIESSENSHAHHDQNINTNGSESNSNLDSTFQDETFE